MLRTESLREQRHSADAESLKQLMEGDVVAHTTSVSLSLSPLLSYVVANLIFLTPPAHPLRYVVAMNTSCVWIVHMLKVSLSYDIIIVSYSHVKYKSWLWPQLCQSFLFSHSLSAH